MNEMFSALDNMDEILEFEVEFWVYIFYSLLNASLYMFFSSFYIMMDVQFVWFAIRASTGF